MPATFAFPMFPYQSQAQLSDDSHFQLTSIQKGQNIEQCQHWQQPVINLSQYSARLFVMVDW
jgi:hypothetical protein